MSSSIKDANTKDHVEYIEDEIEKSYDRNIDAQIRNPLAGFTDEELDEQVIVFCDKYGFTEQLELFQVAAKVAQRPDGFDRLACLTDEDKYHLHREVTHRWHLPMQMYLCIGIASIGSAIQGCDNTGANGANLSFPQEFGIEHRPWLVGVINAGPALFGLLSAWAADPINSLLGRRGTIFVTNIFVTFPVLAQAFTQNWWELMLCRLFMGLGMGVKISTIPIYTAEVSPAPIRGGLVTSFQLWVAFGILMGFSSNLIFMDIGPLAWRYQLAAAFVPAVPLLILIWFVPESPRWLMKKGRYQKAFASFCRIRTTRLIAAREMYYAHCQIMAEEVAFEGRSLTRRCLELFTVPRIRRATVASAWVVISQQFSGINIMGLLALLPVYIAPTDTLAKTAFYSSTIFSEAGYSVRNSLLASFGSGLVTFLFAIPAIYTMDTFGRRNLLLFTFPNMAWCLLAAGFCFYIPASSSAKIPLIAFFVYLFSAFYGTGIGPIPSIYFSEAFPLSHREIGGALTICINNAVSSALGITFPALLAKVTPVGAFCLYAGLNIVALIGIFLIVPETRKRTLEELDFVFAVPTVRHARYQLRVWLPWFCRRWLLFRRGEVLEPLYKDMGRSD